MRYAWIDPSAGIAGDMLLGALLDAGADRAVVQAAVDAVVAGSVMITAAEVTRAGLRATKAEVEMTVTDPPHRTWATIQTMITGAVGDRLPASVAERAYAVFARLAQAEGRVHGIPAEDVHFHEVGALDSIADVVGVCAALHDLGVEALSAGPVALGSGQIRAAHGTIPVPVPAVAELATGWRVSAGGGSGPLGELTTPTGMALLAALADRCEDLPALTVERTGVGAGTKDFPGRANVTRVVLGQRASAGAGDGASRPGSEALLLECNVDDLDPRLWPDVLARLITAGADDAWLTPMIMKKGRPAHVLSVLCDPRRADVLRGEIFAATSTFGVRQRTVEKFALPRTWTSVEVSGGPVRVKVAHLDQTIVRVSPEFDSVAERAAALHRSQADVLTAATAAAAAAGVVVGAPVAAIPADGAPPRGAQ